MARIGGPSKLLAAPEQSPPGACFTIKQEDTMNRIDGIIAAQRYLRAKQQARDARIFSIAYWGILVAITGIALAFAFVKLGWV
jgi:hypothetical protein